jgi:hypothetical protein
MPDFRNNDTDTVSASHVVRFGTDVVIGCPPIAP